MGLKLERAHVNRFGSTGDILSELGIAEHEFEFLIFYDAADGRSQTCENTSSLFRWHPPG